MRRQLTGFMTAAAALLAMVVIGVSGASARHATAARAAAPCADPDNYSAQRDPSNPLELATPPGADPLAGASFFVDGPARGAAASAIARLVGLDPTHMSTTDSWASFQQRLQSGDLSHKLASDPKLAHEVGLLEKIAAQPEVNRFSLYSGGGGPGAIDGQVHKIVCSNLAADPGTVPIFSTYFLYQAPHGGYCESKSEILQYRARFERQVNEMVSGIDRRPAVMLLELDAVGASHCMLRTGALRYWEQDISYEVAKVASLPHTVVYVEGGYADGNSPAYTARVLNAIGIQNIRGFFTNDTHEDWTINEVHWAEAVSRLTHGARFIVNTANNGRGPLVPHNRVKHGNEVLCNPSGRGLGPQPTTTTGFATADAFLWTAPPGNSGGHCNGGPASGTFWPAYAEGEASRADGRLGPGYPSRPF